MRPGISRPGRRAVRRGRPPASLRTVACLLLWSLSCLVASMRLVHAAPDRIEIGQAAFESRDDGYYVSGDFELDLKPRIAEALDRGLTLFFVVEAELTRSRWYWFDEKSVTAALHYRLSYYALTRQYRLSTGNLQVGFPTLAEALGVMSHVRDWKIAERGGPVRPGESYAAAVRMRLDTTQLPKPFQINAIANRDWTLESDWKRSVFEAH